MKGFNLEKINLEIFGKNILKNISTSFLPGTITGIVGPNGAGKTSLLKVLAGIYKPNDGVVYFKRKKINNYNRVELAKKISYLPQEISIAWPLSVYNTVSIGLFVFKKNEISEDFRRKKIFSILQELDLDEKHNTLVNKLSTGERARVCLARALVGIPEFLLADEPVSFLDPFYQITILDLLRKKSKDGMASIIVMHDLNLAKRYCDNIVIIEDGNIFFEGTPEVSFNNEILRTIFSVEYDDNNNIQKYSLGKK